MTEQKPLDPTQRKIEKAKEKGAIAFSEDFLSVPVLLFGVCALIGFWAPIRKMAEHFWGNLGGDLSTAAVEPLLRYLLFFFCGILLVTLIGYALQGKLRWRTLSSSRSTHGVRKLYVFGAGLVKVSLLLAVGLILLKKPGLEAMYAAVFTPVAQGAFFFRKALYFVLSLLGVFFILSVGDLFYRKWSGKRALRMSVEEAKEERREYEGNPDVKAERKRRR